jgi:hypothetical protein
LAVWHAPCIELISKIFKPSKPDKMTNQIEYDLILKSELVVEANSVKTYMRNGWVPKTEIATFKNTERQQEEHGNATANKHKKGTIRQKSWIPWPKL